MSRYIVKHLNYLYAKSGQKFELCAQGSNIKRILRKKNKWLYVKFEKTGRIVVHETYENYRNFVTNAIRK